MVVGDMTARPARVDSTPGQYPVNLRLTIPFLPRSFFLTVIVGPERRGRERRQAERRKHPVNTWGNLATFVVLSTVCGTAALFAALVLATL